MEGFKDPELHKKLISHEIETELGRIEYVEFGEGPAVVCIHGAMGGYDQSVILAQTVADAGYRFIAISRPGYLGTPLSSGETPRQQADLIAALLGMLKINRAGVLAISGGGPAAIEFAIHNPALCSGLVLISTCAEKTENKTPFSFKIMTALVRWNWFADMVKNKATKNMKAMAGRSIQDPEILEKTVNDKDTWPLFCQLLLSTFDRMDKRMAGTKNDIQITRSCIYDLEKLTAPTLIIHGTKDPMLNFKKQTGVYMSRLPNAELLAVEGGEHVAIFTHREMVSGNVNLFMLKYFK